MMTARRGQAQHFATVVRHGHAWPERAVGPQNEAIMGRLLAALGAAMLAGALTASAANGAPDKPSSPIGGADPFLWLEEAQSPRALAWVAAENAKTEAALRADARFQANYDALIEVSTASRYAPAPGLLGGGVSIFSVDPAYPRGLVQWAPMADYQGAATHWRTLIDVGALDAAESANWVVQAIDCPPFNADRCLVTLSAGGADAAELREFDLKAGGFVAGGFQLPHGKQIAGWVDPDTLIVGRDWGPGTTTAAGYPFVVKLLKRGQNLSQAREVFRGAPGDANVWPYVLSDGQGHKAVLIQRARDIRHTETYQLTPSGVIRLAVPPQATLRGLFHGKLVFTLEQDWRFHGQAMRSGALVAVPLAWLGAPDAPAARDDPALLVFQPGPRQSIGAGRRRACLSPTMRPSRSTPPARAVRARCRTSTSGRPVGRTATPCSTGSPAS
jgi:prolyl oligopeptidase